MLLFRPSRTWLGLFFLVFFFSLFFFLPKKALAVAPTATLVGAVSGIKDQPVSYTVYASDSDGNLGNGRIELWYSSTTENPPGQWYQIGGTYTIDPFATTNAQWSWTHTFTSTGTYYVVANVYDAAGQRCGGNPWCTMNGGTYNCGATWYACSYNGGVNGDLLTTTINPAGASSTITGATFEDWHNPYEICWDPLPAEAHLLSTVYTTISGNENPSIDYDKIYYFLSYQSGDSTPPGATLQCYNASGQLVSCSDPGVTQRWWRYIGDITPYGLNRGAKFPMSVKGLCSSPTCNTNRTIQINLFDSYYNITRDYKTFTHNIDRTPPNYSGNYTLGSCTVRYPGDSTCTQKLRLEKPGGIIISNPVGTLGDSVVLRPYSPTSDSGGFGVDRVDLWVAYRDGDTPSGLSCPPNPPYSPSDPDNFSCNPSSCTSFGLGTGRAWYIGSVYGAGGGTVTWNTNGFATGTRYIVANIFDNPGNRRGANFLTYTSNGANPYFARVDYNLTLPISPWIKTVSGDVHSNTRINTPGGPP